MKGELGVGGSLLLHLYGVRPCAETEVGGDYGGGGEGFGVSVDRLCAVLKQEAGTASQVSEKLMPSTMCTSPRPRIA